MWHDRNKKRIAPNTDKYIFSSGRSFLAKYNSTLIKVKNSKSTIILYSVYNLRKDKQYRNFILIFVK